METVLNETIAATTTTWVIDPAHSELLFKVRHLMISNVKGEFRKISASVLSDNENFSKSRVSVKIDASSIFTNNEQRDGHLRSADFFDVEKYSEILFEGTDFTRIDGNEFKLKGDLTIKGITKEVVLDVEYGGTIDDPYGNKRAGFTFSGKINRQNWGLNWNAALESGGVMVSDEVRINGEVQLVKQAS